MIGSCATPSGASCRASGLVSEAECHGGRGALLKKP